MNEFPALASRVLDLISASSDHPLRERDLSKILELGSGNRGLLRTVLRDLEQEGRLECSRGGRWRLARAQTTITGLFRVRSNGTAWLLPDDPKEPLLSIDSSSFGGAIPGDRVQVVPIQRASTARMFGSGAALRVGRVTRILERKREWVVGTLYQTPYYFYVVPLDPLLRINIPLQDAPAILRPHVGKLVVAKLHSPAPGLEEPSLAADFVRVLGDPNDPALDIPALLQDRGISDVFAPAVVKAADQTKARFQKRGAETAGRVDLREQLTFTIDPADAHDFDDAVSVERLSSGGWKLGVHIADVPAFVEPGSEIDRDAFRRGNTTYLVDRAIFMLPGNLTAHVCSLQPDEDHLAHSVEMMFDSGGTLLESKTFRSVIRSTDRLSYDQVQQVLDGGSPSFSDPVAEAIRHLNELTTRLRAARFENGALDFAIPEIHCELDEKGNPVAFTQRGSSEAYHLIEECMLAANQVVAKKIFDSGRPGIYRIHDEPSEEQWARMNDELHALGHRTPVRNAHDINRVAASVKGEPDQYIVTLSLLRNMKRAVYDPECRPHFGLAFTYYTHFTSPIRRYPDLVIHRILCAIENQEPSPYSASDLGRIALHCSDTERQSADLENQSLQFKRIRYYANCLAQKEIGPWRGIVTSLNPKGLIVELCDTFQQGLLPFHALQGAYRLSDDGFSAHTAKKAGGFRLGQMLEVCLAAVDEQRKRVDFYLPTSKNRPKPSKNAKNKKKKTQNFHQNGKKREKKSDFGENKKMKR